MGKLLKKNKKKPKKTAPKMVPSDDIIKLILTDHKPLKTLIQTLKDSAAEIEEKRECFDEFATLLIAHAKPEASVLYLDMKEGGELREEGFEGEVEHEIAERLLEEINETSDEDLWCARVKVVAELVEHHIKEEEKTMLPDYKRNSNLSERIELGQRYLELKDDFMPQIRAEKVDRSRPYISQLHH